MFYTVQSMVSAYYSGVSGKTQAVFYVKKLP